MSGHLATFLRGGGIALSVILLWGVLTPAKAEEQSIGERLFEGRCARCHETGVQERP